MSERRRWKPLVVGALTRVGAVAVIVAVLGRTFAGVVMATWLLIPLALIPERRRFKVLAVIGVAVAVPVRVLAETRSEDGPGAFLLFLLSMFVGAVVLTAWPSRRRPEPDDRGDRQGSGRSEGSL